MKSIRFRITLVVVLIVFVITAVHVSASLFFTYRALCDNVDADMDAIGEIANVAISTEIALVKGQAASIALTDAGENPSYQDWINAAHQTVERSGFPFDCIALVDSQGRTVASDDEIKSINFAETEYFKNALNGTLSISQSEVNDNGESVFFIAVPVRGLPNFNGVMITELDSMVFSDLIKNITIGKTGNVFILDANGVFVANIRDNLVLERQNFIELAKTDSNYKTAAAVFQRMINGETDTDRYVYDGSERMVSFGPIGDSAGWSYGACAPIKEMTSDIYTSAIGSILTGLIFLVLGIIASYTLALSISSPIIKVTKRMQLLSQGNLSENPPDVKRRDEVGVLAASVTTTIQALKNYILDIDYVLSEMASGNFDVNSKADFKGDFSSIKDSLNKISESMNGALCEFSNVSSQVSAGSEQVAQAAQNLSSGAEAQTISIQQLATEIEGISEKVNENAKHTLDAAEMVSKSGDKIESGNKQMHDVTQAMQEISTSSNEVVNIIKTIEDIAFQTNILALNAAVEAARAGEAGKGFSVVAEEVRSLASKSDEAAKNSAELISESNKSIENGIVLVNSAAKSFDEINEISHKIVKIVENISDATTKQSDAIENVNFEVAKISDVVGANSSSAEQSAATSEQLSGQAQVLNSLVAKFRFRRK